MTRSRPLLLLLALLATIATAFPLPLPLPVSPPATGHKEAEPLVVCDRVAQRLYASTFPQHLPPPFRPVDRNAPGCTAVSFAPGHAYRVSLHPSSPSYKHHGLRRLLLPSWLYPRHHHDEGTIQCLARCSSHNNDGRTGQGPIPAAHLLVAPADLPPALAGGPPSSLLGLLSMIVPSVPLGLLLERGDIRDVAKVECCVYGEEEDDVSASAAAVGRYRSGATGWLPYPPLYVCISSGRSIS